MSYIHENKALYSQNDILSVGGCILQSTHHVPCKCAKERPLPPPPPKKKSNNDWLGLKTKFATSAKY